MITALINIAFWASTFLTLLILLLPSQYGVSKESNKQTEKNGQSTARGKGPFQVLVLGDIGRSPRMQYHALSIAKRGGQVDIIGYQESDIHPDITANPRISIVPLSAHPSFLQTSNKILFLFFGPLKVVFQLWSLWRCLAYRTEPAKWLLVQNPPSIPSLAVASLVCFLRNTALVIDWHNFGYSILALKLGDQHPLVKISKSYEIKMCRYATAHLCVTNAMARDLKHKFSVKAPILPLHDRPASHLQPIRDDTRRLEFLLSLQETAEFRTLLGSGDARVLVSSTSWTADEDFSILIEALTRYSDLAVSGDRKLPHILAIITGKGPQRDMYLERIASLKKAGKLQRVDIKSAWLSTHDYASLLASASLGVSLHTSSSGVDLPMKVVDMFGAGLPVVGWDRFEAWPELVTEGVNGRGFGSAEELVQHLVDLFGNPAKLATLREGALKEGSRRWDDEWDPVAGKLFGLVEM
ncbi:CAZyme family GT33 [Paecilomyces variotii]|nr:CAZyme family GT33 [Paecilomyces variotii]KAJ9313923.1 CAZyme family GT33 [Paecilomyces variotii]